MPRFFYPIGVRLTQAQITAGDANALDSVKIIVVDGSGVSTGVIYESGPAGTAPTQVSTAASSLLNNFTATTAPTVNDDSGDGYAVGSRWVDVTADESYICVDAAVGAAVWSRTTVGTIAEVSGLQTALDAKAPTANPTFTGTVSGVTAAHVGLANVANTSDANKPVSTAQQTALDAKQATLVSGTNIRSVNGSSLVGAGNVSLAADLPGGAAQTVTDEGLATTGSPTIDRTTVPGETIITFTVSGTFTTPLGVTSARHLVVGGGGGGGGGESNSFGGAGGGGGASLTADSSTNGNAGGQSAFGAVTANGGGGGGGDANTPSGSRNGANSGGGSGDLNFAPGTAEAGGFVGGTGGSGRAGAGGGGDGGVGENAGVDGVRQGGDGGIGTASNITGASITYAGGAGGGGNSNGGTALGGTGADGGGNGDTSTNNTTGAGSGGSVGAANRGGGGGGASGRGGFAGGSGVVIVRFPTQTRSYQSLQAFANDAAAATGGLLVGQFYRDSSTSAVRQRAS